jgi:hypothetical protein
MPSLLRSLADPDARDRAGIVSPCASYCKARRTRSLDARRDEPCRHREYNESGQEQDREGDQTMAEGKVQLEIQYCVS